MVKHTQGYNHRRQNKRNFLLKNYYQKNAFGTENHGKNILHILGQNKRISFSFILKGVILKRLLLYTKLVFSSSLYRNNSYTQ